MTTNSAKVIALSKATPQHIDMNGRQVFTSIVRDPIAGPLHIVSDGIEGNSTAVHSEHILAFNAEHYDFWAHELGVSRKNWNWSWWGENLTVTGIDEEELRVGDVIQIGDAEFRVTSPRIPCFKVAWRMGRPDSILPRLMETGRVGFHLEVLRGGHVALNDPIVLSSPCPENITVADLSRLLLSQSIDDVPLLKRTAALPALGVKAAGSVRRRITYIEDRERMRIGRWRGWRKFAITNIQEEADGVRSFYIRPGDGDLLAPPAAGQFLTIKTEQNEQPDLVRPWSVSGVDLENRQYRLTIKEIEGGAASSRMHRHMRIGDVLWARPPAGQFVLDRSGYKRIAMISAGIGVTPVLQMLQAYVELGDNAPPLVWMQVVKNGRNHPFRDEVAALFGKVSRGRKIIYYTQPTAHDRLGVDYDRAGRPAPDDIAEIFKGQYVITATGRDVSIPGTETEFYLCGPESFQDFMHASLSKMGVKPGAVHSEAFVTSGRSASAATPAVDRAQVVFSRSGITAEWHADDGNTLLDLAESVGLSPTYACRSGTCQSCQCDLTEGLVAYDPAPSAQPGAGKVLICCARPATERLQIDL